MIALETIITGVMVGAIGSVVVVSVVPKFHEMLLYGKTWEKKPSDGASLGVVNWISQRLTVPKYWFAHFYTYYFILSLWVMFYRALIWQVAAVFGVHCIYYEHVNIGGISSSSSSSRSSGSGLKNSSLLEVRQKASATASILPVLILIQSGRRLFESLYITKFSSSGRINITHFAAGIVFYLAISLTVGTTVKYIEECILQKTTTAILWPQVENITQLSGTQVAALVGFSIASIDQFCNHKYLASLVKYTEPTQGLFHYVAAAHYFDEIVIYSSIALFAYASLVVTLPNLVNIILCALFVFINLSVSALQSLKYYQKRGSTKRHAIIPMIL